MRTLILLKRTSYILYWIFHFTAHIFKHSVYGWYVLYITAELLGWNGNAKYMKFNYTLFQTHMLSFPYPHQFIFQTPFKITNTGKCDSLYIKLSGHMIYIYIYYIITVLYAPKHPYHIDNFMTQKHLSCSMNPVFVV
jgi:hypothetical protein